MSQPESPSPYLLLTFPEAYPDASVDEVLADFALPESFVRVKKQEFATYAAFEWTIPTVFAAYLGKTLIDALLKEVAKEYTPNIIAGLKALAVRCKQMNIRWLTATESTHKRSRKYQQSAAFSIVVQTKSGQQMKMLFDEQLSPAEWEDAIDGMLATVAANYVHYPNDSLTQSPVVQTTKPTSSLYVIYNRERSGWEIHNDQTLLAIRQNQTPKTES